MNNEKTYIVYKHTNKYNNKVYIGMTSKSLKTRKENGYFSSKSFYNDLHKYHWSSFESVVIAEGLTKDEASDLEIKLIKEYNSTNPELGYNMSTGGVYSHKGCIHNEEQREKYRIGSMYIHRGENSPQSKAILKLSKDGQVIKEYPSIGEAERQEGAYKGSIVRVLTGKRKTYRGYIYVYKN